MSEIKGNSIKITYQIETVENGVILQTVCGSSTEVLVFNDISGALMAVNTHYQGRDEVPEPDGNQS